MIIASIFAGQWARLRCKKRIDNLERIKILIRFFETELKFCRTSVIELLTSAEKRFDDKRFGFLKECRILYKAENSFPEAWKQAVETFPPDGFTKHESELLISFGTRLGTTDLEGQVNICRLYDSLFDGQLHSAKNDLNQKGALYSGLGAAGGLFLAVIAI